MEEKKLNIENENSKFFKKRCRLKKILIFKEISNFKIMDQ
jgi:hypothetical protein